jgi:hypothetical protein
MVIGVFVLFGLSLWTAILAALMLGCPIVAFWAYFTGRSPGARADARPRLERDAMTPSSDAGPAGSVASPAGGEARPGKNRERLP